MSQRTQHSTRFSLAIGIGIVATLILVPSAFAQGDVFEGSGGSTNNPYQPGGYNTPTTPTYDPAIQGNRGYTRFQKNPENDAADRNQQRNSEIVTGRSGQKRGPGIVGKAGEAAKKAIQGAGRYGPMVPGIMDTPDPSTGPQRLPNGAFPISVKDNQFIVDTQQNAPLTGIVPGGPIYDVASFTHGLHTITWKYKRGGGIKGDTLQCPFTATFTCRVKEDRGSASRPYTYMKGRYTRNSNGSGYLSELEYSYDGYTYEADSRGRDHLVQFQQSSY